MEFHLFWYPSSYFRDQMNFGFLSIAAGFSLRQIELATTFKTRIADAATKFANAEPQASNIYYGGWGRVSGRG
jgi:hypothetical protein